MLYNVGFKVEMIQFMVQKRISPSDERYLVVIFGEIVQETDQMESRFQEKLASGYKRVQTAQVEVVGERMHVKKYLTILN